MGTTLTAIESQHGVALHYVLAIEGFEYLLTSGKPSKVVTAWASSAWSKALPGLHVAGNFTQRWDPFGNELSVSSINCHVQCDPTDIFGKAVFKSSPTFRAELTADFETNDTVINVKNTSALGSSGTVFIGGKSYSYSGKTSTTLTGVASKLAPIDTDTLSTGQFPGKHTATSSNSINSPLKAKPPEVTDVPKQWVGRTVALYLTREVDGVYDVKAQAHLVMAGQIADIYEGEPGRVSLLLEDFRRKIADTTLLQDQWTATPAKGFYFRDGDWISAKVVVISPIGTTEPSSSLTCVTGASGTDEFEPGRYTAEEVCSLIADWLNNDATMSHATTGYSWTCAIVAGKFRMIAEVNGSSAWARIMLRASSRETLELLGFDTEIEDSGVSTTGFNLGMATAVKVYGDLGEDEFILGAQLGPIIVGERLGFHYEKNNNYLELESDSQSGTFIDQTSSIPSEFKKGAASGETWGVFTLDDKWAFAGRKVSATVIDSIRQLPFLGSHALSESGADTSGRREGSEPKIRQVLAISGTFTDVLTKLLASTDGNGVNHATYDVLPFGAGIPWGVLGTGWLNSCKGVAQANATDSITILVEKPTTLWDCISAELMLRMAFFVWKTGGIQLGCYQTPNASVADWVLSEATKAMSPGTGTKTETRHHQDWLTNNIKIQYNRSLADGKYQSEIVIRDVESIESYGLAKPFTVNARNCYPGSAAAGVAVESMAENFAAIYVPAFGKPVRTWRVPTNPQLIDMVPGEVVSVTDNWARDPETGALGVNARAATVLETSWSLGISAGPDNANFSATVMYTEEDRTYPVSPCAEHDETYASGLYTAGYDSTNKRLATKKNQHSLSTDAADCTYFAAGDEVTVFEIDPADPSSADLFSDTVVAVSSSSPYYIQLTNGFGGGNPAFSSSKVYRVVPDKYADADSGQLDTCFLADNADDLIQDTVEPNSFGAFQRAGASDYDLTELPALHVAESYEEGRPLHPGLIQDVALMVNNLHNHKLRPQAPMLLGSIDSETSKGLLQIILLPISHLRPRANKTLKASIGVTAYVASGSVTFDVYSTGEPPVAGFGFTNFVGPYNSVSFTTTSTTAWQHLAAQELDLIRSELFPGFTFIVVDVNQASTATYYYKGLHTLRVLDGDQ